jgi:hypothetical protein
MLFKEIIPFAMTVKRNTNIENTKLLILGAGNKLTHSEISGSGDGAYEVTVFWDIAPYSLFEVDRRFRGAYFLHRQGIESLSDEFTSKRIHGTVSQKTVIVKLKHNYH